MKSMVKEVLNTVLYVAVVLVITFFFIRCVAQRTEVSGHSMDPTLQHGDSLIMEKVTYRFREPKRFEIIVFPYRYKADTYYIKRIIGLPGETVYIDPEGTIYINGEPLEENYGKEVIQSPGLAAEPITLGDNEYFVLGDNRNHSSDSRDPSVGNIRREEIEGRAFVRIWPLTQLKILEH